MKKCERRDVGKIGNTKSILPSRNLQYINWFFTLNCKVNGSNEILARPTEVYEKLKSMSVSFTFQQEIGDKGKYEHYQGTFQLQKRNRMSALKKLLWDEIHLEPTRNIEASEKYCMKEKGRIDGPWKYPNDVKTIEENKLYDWQKDVINIVKEEPDDRTIHWIWDEKGCAGKTTFAKYLCIKYNACYISGNSKDIKFMAAEKDSPIYIFDFVRSMEDKISYEAIESIKNGIYFSGKYESKQVIRNCPHVICMANFRPEKIKLSLDRWHVVQLE